MGARLILVADDEEAIRVLVADMLTFEGYRIETVENGSDALRAVARVVPALILLDLQMPPLDGFAGAHHNLTRICVIMVEGLFVFFR